MGRARKRKVKYVQPGYRHRARAAPPSPAERIARLSPAQVLERITRARLHQKELAGRGAAAGRLPPPPQAGGTGSNAPMVTAPARAGRTAVVTPGVLAAVRKSRIGAGTPRIVRGGGPSSVKGTRRSFLTAPQKRSSVPTLERRSLCRPYGPDGEGQAGGQARQARGELVLK